MKTYLIKYGIRVGEFEYSDSLRVKAKNASTAEELAEKKLAEWYDPKYWAGEYREPRLGFAMEITEAEAKTLNRLGLSWEI